MSFPEIINQGLMPELYELWKDKVDSISFLEQANELTGNSWEYPYYSRFMNFYESILEEKMNTIDFKLENKKIQQERAILNKRITQIARLERLEETVKNNITHSKYRIPVTNKKHLDELPYYILSDIHYNHDNQLEKTFKSFKNKEINLIINGDFIKGALRISDLVDGTYDIINDAIDFTKELLRLIEKYEIIVNKLVLIHGNHDQTRFTEYKGTKNAHITDIIRFGLENIFDVYVGEKYETENFLIQHGHQFKGKKAFLNNKFDKLHIIGHFHDYTQTYNHLILPAIAKTDEYAKSLGLDGIQGYAILHEKSIEIVKIRKEKNE